MEPLFICPPAAALTEIPNQDCAEVFGQIQRFFFQRKQATPSFTSTTIKVAATWTPLLAASGDTKMVATPLIPNVVIPAGEILTEGGNDNTTLNGIPRLLGRGFAGVTMQLPNADKEVRSAIRKLANESKGFTNLWMYMVNAFGQVIANADSSGIDVYNVMVGDPGTEGFNRDNIANMRFDLAPGWADNVILHTPTAPFNPLNL